MQVTETRKSAKKARRWVHNFVLRLVQALELSPVHSRGFLLQSEVARGLTK